MRFSKYLLITCLLILISPGCFELPYEYGYCEVIYNNIERLPSQSVKVKVSNHESTVLNYTLIPYDNMIKLPLDAGYSYSLEVEGQRKDTLYNVMVIRFGKDYEKLKYYTFMFNNTIHNNISNIIIINL